MMKIRRTATYRLLNAINGFWACSISDATRKSKLTYSHVTIEMKELKRLKLVRTAKPEECRNKPNKRTSYIILTQQGIRARTIVNELAELLEVNGNGD